MARPSEVCEYCPTADSIEFPTNTNDWTDDYIPRWIKLALPYWKGKRGTRMWYFYLNRNYVDPRLCPVIFMMMWLRASGIKKGPITGVLGSKSDLTFFASRLTTSCKRANKKNRITD